MIGEIKFIKQDDNWYADIPEYIESGGTFEDCLMVSGAPELIRMLGGESKGELTVTVSTDWIAGFDAVLSKDFETVTEVEGAGWSYYLATVYNRVLPVAQPSIHSASLIVGLCPVNAWVFYGKHPNTIYIKINS